MICRAAVIIVVAFSLAIPAATVAGEGHKGCPMKDSAVASSVAFSGEGRLLCMHCNLHREESCRKVYQAANDESELIEICPSTQVDLEAVSREGDALLRIAGRMVTSEDGRKMLVIESAEQIGE